MRKARKRSESGIYHIVLRGINRQDIFFHERDYRRFLETVAKMKSEEQFAIYGYCLMSNHVHLLIREHTDGISRIMNRIGSSYAWWVNQTYGRSGHVFQGRFGSECVEDDRYLLTVVRYIHNNPVKAGIVEKAEDYRWSSIHAYYGAMEYPRGICGPGFILSMFHQKPKTSIPAFREFMEIENDDKCLEIEGKPRKSDREIKSEIEKLMDPELLAGLRSMEKARRNRILQKIKAIDGVTLRQISRITGLSVDMVFKA